MEGIKVNRRPRLKNPILVVAWPGMGEVAFKAVSYLIDKLKAEEFAEIPPEEFFYLTASVINNGILSLPELPLSKFYFWKNPAKREGTDLGGQNNDLILFLSNAQPDLIKAEGYCQRIISLARHFKVKTVVSFAAMPQPIDHTQAVKVWYAGVSAEINNLLKKYNLLPMREGQISGMNGLFLGIAKKEGMQGFCLLGDIPLYTVQIENPKASYAVLEAICKIFGLKVDLSQLLDQSHTVETEINKLLDYLKLGSQGPGPIGEDDIEKIKKSLSQFTKLPVSVKDKIEKLFEQTKFDIARAGELKTELDKWNVYKEYEDRFLDLFRKTQDKSN